MEKFSLQPDEHLLINDPHAMWMKGAMMAIQGQLKLTEKRIVFEKNANPLAGILSLFLKNQRQHVLHDIPLSSITNFSTVTFAKSERLVIDNGVSLPLTFATSKIDTFIPELKRLTGK